MPGQFERLLQPFQIREVKLRNRIWNAAHNMYFSDEAGYVNGVVLAHYETLAKGGVGLIVMEWCSVDYPLGARHGHHTIASDKYVPGLRRLTDSIHRHDCPVFLQLGHAGPAQVQSEFNVQPVAASALDGAEKPYPGYATARGLTVAEIEDIVAKFAAGAARARQAGFDGVEVNGGHGYLPNTFFSRVWNRRTDAYGCQDLTSRARFGVEIVQAIKERVGSSFPVGVRLNGREWGHEWGTTIEEAKEFARMLERAGADYISVSGMGYGAYQWMVFPEQVLYPAPTKATASLAKQLRKPGALVPAAAAIKQAVSVPVVAAGRLDPKLGEWLLRNNMADLIGMVRRLIADPELPNKLAGGRYDEIAPCTACGECLGRVIESKALRCRVNAAVGRELEYEIKPAGRKKKVVVVGAGPAGMEAARVAALRGHEVVLYEKQRELGGLLPLASLLKGTDLEDIPSLPRYFRAQLEKLGVTVHLGRAATAALIEDGKPDVVVVATGGLPTKPAIPGVERGFVLGGADLRRLVSVPLRLLGPDLLGRLTKFWMPVGRRVVIVGGLMQGCELAEFLVKRGREVTIVEEGEQLGSGIPEINRPRLITWLQQQGVAMLGGVRYEEITAQGLTLITKEGERRTIPAHTVLTALPFQPNAELALALNGKVAEVYQVGDCTRPGKIIDATEDGRRVGCSL